MRSTLLRSGAVTIGATLALAACSGHGVVPSSPGYTVTSPMSAVPAQRHRRAACPQPAWVFMGACQVGRANPKGFSIKLAAYNGYTVSIAVPPSNVKVNTPFVLVDATGKGDIKPYKGMKFPLYKGAFYYIQSVNGGKTNMKFSKGNIIFSIGAMKKFPSGTYGLAYFNGKTWAALPFPGSVKGKTLTFSIPGALIDAEFGGLKPGPLYVGVFRQ
jgi:hypothetical protein